MDWKEVGRADRPLKSCRRKVTHVRMAPGETASRTRWMESALCLEVESCSCTKYKDSELQVCVSTEEQWVVVINLLWDHGDPE